MKMRTRLDLVGERLELVREFAACKELWRQDPAYPARPNAELVARFEALMKEAGNANLWAIVKR